MQTVRTEVPFKQKCEITAFCILSLLLLSPPPGPLLHRQSLCLLHFYSHDSCNNTWSRQVNSSHTQQKASQAETFIPNSTNIFLFVCFALIFIYQEKTSSSHSLFCSSHCWVWLQVLSCWIQLCSLPLSASVPLHGRDLVLCNCNVL